MASEIIVQNLKGPASGANANKVIVPSGHTLDATNGFIPPAGIPVQIKRASASSTFTTTSGAWTATGLSISITPKYSGSVFVFGHMCQTYNSYGSYIDWYNAVFLNGSAPGVAANHRTDTGSGRVLHAYTGYTAPINSTSAQTFEVYMAQGGGTFTGFVAGAQLWVQEIKQ